MSAGLGQLQLDQPDRPVTPPPQLLPSTSFERIGAAWNAAIAPDRYDLSRESKSAVFQQRAAEYEALTGEKLASPFDVSVPLSEQRKNPNKPIEFYLGEREKTAREKLGKVRGEIGDDMQGIPAEYLNYDSINQTVAAAGNAARERAARLEGSGHGLAAFGAGMAGSMTRPDQMAAAVFLGATDLPRRAAAATIAEWTGNILKEGAYQAAVNTAAAVPGMAIEYRSRAEIGTEPSIEEMIQELGLAAAGGFVLGASVRTAQGIFSKLHAKGIELPPDVKDAAIAVEGDALFANKNALQMPAHQFEKVTDEAVANVLVGKPAAEPPRPPGRPATVHEIARSADPALMSRYDRLSAEIETIRNQINASPEDLRAEAKAAEAEMLSKPRTGSEAKEYVARIKRFEDQAAALEGTGPEPDHVAALRTQMAVIDAEMRDMLPKIRETYNAHPELHGMVIEPPDPIPNIRIDPENRVNPESVIDNLPEGTEAPPAPAPVAPVPDKARAEGIAALEKADRLGLTEEIRRRAEAGETALSIEMALGQKITSSEIRAVLKAEPINAANLELAAEAQRVAKLADEMPETYAPADTTAKLGRPTEEVIGLTPEETKLVQDATTLAETKGIPEHQAEVARMEELSADERKLAAIAKRCGIPGAA